MKYGHWAKNCRHLVEIFPKGLPNVQFTCYQWQLGGNIFSNIFKHFRTWSQKVSAFRRFFSAGWSKQQSTYPEEQFNEKQLFEKRILFWPFSDNERKISGRLAISFWLSCQNCLLRVRRNFWRRKNIGKKIVNFGFERKFFGFCRIFFRGCKDCLLRVHWNNLKEKKFTHKNCILPNSHKLRTFLAFGWNLSNGVFKTAFYVFIKTIPEETFVEKIFISS